MSEAWKAKITRRPFLVALGAVAGAAVAGSAMYEGVRFWHGGGGASGDLLASLGGREEVVLVGKAVLADMPKFRAAEAARALRRTAATKPLSELLTADAIEGRIIEAQGWVLPQTLALLCAVAASGAEAHPQETGP
jgi:hypothetical protein